MIYNTGESRIFSSHGLLTTVAYQLGPYSKPCYALEVRFLISERFFHL
jgi:glycerol kinase